MKRYFKNNVTVLMMIITKVRTTTRDYSNGVTPDGALT